jgi:NAD(P)-dependent dehydrogenase (short-subunit alcohol dehydrogenase family)
MRRGRSDRGRGTVGVVTGGGSGIGASIGRWLARHGADVVLFDVDEAGLHEVADEINGADGGRARVQVGDVTDEDAVADLVGTVRSEHGRLDYLFPNAGVAGPVELDETGSEDWRRVIDVNVNGVFFATKQAVPLLEGGDGTSHIVVTASISGRKPKPIMVPYRTSKAAVIMLSRCLATALGPDVKVNALCPGRIDTPLVESLYERRAEATDTTPEEIRGAEEDVPLKRTPDHEDILGVLDYIIFQDGFVTGHEFHLDGGGYQAL